MKNLANCKPTEFLQQTVKIKRAAEGWLDATKILDIRKNTAKIELVNDDMTEGEKKAVLERNKKARAAQLKENFSRIFDSVMEENAVKTLELLALVCFIDPAEVDSHPIDEYLKAVTEMIDNEAVIGFFTSLAKWGLLNT